VLRINPLRRAFFCDFSSKQVCFPSEHLQSSKIRAFMKLKFITLLFTLAAIAAQSAFAEKADKDKPMNVEADSLKHDDQKQLTIFTGKVLMTKGTLVLRAARMEVKQDKQGNQVATLSAEPGERVFFRQKREGFDEFTEGEAEAVVYNSQADTLTLTQRAELRLLRGQVVADRIQGQQILVNNTTEVFSVDGKTSPKTNELTPPVAGPVLKPSTRTGADKP
jgi:lipopolysaccharide export system protein LptA